MPCTGASRCRRQRCGAIASDACKPVAACELLCIGNNRRLPAPPPLVAAGAEAKWLLPLVGISPEASALAGVGLAGLSTSLGFMAVQAGMAAVMPRRRCWIDKDAKLA